MRWLQLCSSIVTGIIVATGILVGVCVMVRSHRNENKRIPAIRACLPGPEVKDIDLYNNRKRCLIVGDSISIGYTHSVQKNLQTKCTVYHAPWDIGDGGALDTKHGIHCLDLLMTSSTYQNVTYDVIVFNFGLHDINCDKNRPEEFTPINEYSENLRILKDYFLATKAKVAYALTTPVLDDCDVNNLVVQYNQAASDVMTKNSSVDVINLYKVIEDLCGPAPLSGRTKDCPITNRTLIPHYTKHGYDLLAQPVIRTIERLLEKPPSTAGERLLPSAQLEDKAHQSTGNNTRENNSSKPLVYCSKHKNNWSACPANSTCVKNHTSGSGYGCCLSPNAIDCKTGIHCCPAGTACSHECTKRRCSCIKT